MKYQIGQKVIHVREGLSEIVDIRSINERDFFVVRLCRGGGETIYVPIVGAENIIRDIMTTAEADKLLLRLKSIEKEFNSNTKQRRDAFKRRLASGSIDDIAYMYRQYYLYKKYPDGVKLGPMDIDMLTYATNFILEEMALTYEIDLAEAEDFVANRIEKL